MIGAIGVVRRCHRKRSARANQAQNSDLGETLRATLEQVSRPESGQLKTAISMLQQHAIELERTRRALKKQKEMTNRVLRMADEFQTERDEVIEERDGAIKERDEAIEARDEAIRQRDESLKERDELNKQCDELKFLMNKLNSGLSSVVRATRRRHEGASEEAAQPELSEENLLSVSDMDKQALRLECSLNGWPQDGSLSQLRMRVRQFRRASQMAS